ncbi:MAG: hypothetical protein KJO69_05915, partial [Gammaproteobacteria bacterium]|nr:hypothetical protein [Gammaproteobacteria bacterium]
WNLSKIRPAGAPLKTFGGRASGPEPLDDLFHYAVGVFSGAAGRRLSSIEVHGLVCKVAEIVVVGGVRRSALISLSNLSDDRMRHAKSGQWWDTHPEFALANNSACYTEKPDMETFMREWLSLVESKSGERGIFSRDASQRQAAKSGRRDPSFAFGTNPCSEIILRPNQFCNLSEVVVRYGDTFADLRRKVKIATILGTLQSTLTNFRYLSKVWQRNTEEEALLGVSLTGIMDHMVLSGGEGLLGTQEAGWIEFFGYEEQTEPAVVTEDEYDPPELLNPLSDEDWYSVYYEYTEGYISEKEFVSSMLGYVLEELKNVAIETNKEWAEKLGVKQSAAITCVKPSGTVSQLVDSASGIHPRYSAYYTRTVRADKKDPLAKYMVKAGFPVEDDVMKPETTYVFSFPMKAPESAVFRDERNAIEQLEHWLTYQRHWCEHKPSVTIYVKENEWMKVGAWVYDHFDEMSGVSFLPHSDHTYRQAPYQEITEEEFLANMEAMPKDVDWSLLSEYENEDRTTSSQTLACSGGVCEVVDL